MTKAKAMLYKTAMITYLPVGFENDLPEGFKQGDFVAIEFAGKGTFGWNFRCTNANGDVAIFSENDLNNFVL